MRALILAPLQVEVSSTQIGIGIPHRLNLERSLECWNALFVLALAEENDTDIERSENIVRFEPDDAPVGFQGFLKFPYFAIGGAEHAEIEPIVRVDLDGFFDKP